MTTGLRERKKQQTRQAIHRAAMRLFAERGFDATTIADIAAAADIAPRTFFSYFASKEEVVFVNFEEAFAYLDRVLTERPEGTTALDALRGWIVEAARRFGAESEQERLEALRPRLLAASTIAAIQATKEAHEASDPAAMREMLADPLAVLDDALRFLEGGLAALRS